MFRYIRLLVLAGLVGGVLAGAGLAYLLTRNLPSLEGLEDLRFAANSTLFARDGTPIASVAPVEDGRNVSRMLVKLSDVSPAAVAAVVASEDRRFFQHYGVDFVRLFGGLYYTLRGDLQGGSTISTQVIKNTLLKDLAGVRGLERKLKEFPLALELERRYSKEEILEMYLNVIPWGSNAQGIQAAAQAYFDKDASALTLAEGAYLAVLIPGPNDRYKDLKGSRTRMRRLLDSMVKDGWISQQDATAALKEPLVPKGWQAAYDASSNLVASKLVDPRAVDAPGLEVFSAQHFVLEVRKFLRQSNITGKGGLKIYTTLDPRMQAAAERAVTGVRLPVGAELALAAMDPETGEVYAMVGARPGTEGEFNRATQAWRSPGSAIKPFVYGTALEAGWTQADMVRDSEFVYPDPSQPGGVYKPKNFSGKFLNTSVTIRYALDQSLNIPAIRTAEAIGVKRLGDKLQLAGFRLTNGPSLANAIGGGAEITPVGLAAAYAAFVNGGYRVEPQLVLRVVDAGGLEVYRPEPKRLLLFSPQVAYMVWDMLKGYVYDLGKGSLARGAAIQGRIVGGKTGTSNLAKDLWFAGASRGLVATLWVGRDDNKPQRWRNGSEPSSSTVNPAIWRAFVEEALRGRPSGDFSQPSGLAYAKVDLMSGLASSTGVNMLFTKEKAYQFRLPEPPPEAAPASALPADAPTGPMVLISIDKTTGCLAAPDTPPERTTRIQVPEDKVKSYQCN